MSEHTGTAEPISQAVLPERCEFLDGLRGWGAVVVYHYLVQVLPPSQEAASILSRVIFLNGTLFDSYIPPLWTMSIELIGSAAVIALLAIFGRAKWRLWVYTPVMLVLMAFDSFYGLFVAGILLAELYASGVGDPRWFRGLLVACLCGGLLVPVFSNSVSCRLTRPRLSPT